MKKFILIILITAPIFFSSCTKKINHDANITVSDVTIHEQDSIDSSLKEKVLDTLAYNKNIIISNDRKTVYIFEMIDNKIDLSYKINAPAESEEESWVLFFMFIIILILLS